MTTTQIIRAWRYNLFQVYDQSRRCWMIVAKSHKRNNDKTERKCLIKNEKNCLSSRHNVDRKRQHDVYSSMHVHGITFISNSLDRLGTAFIKAQLIMLKKRWMLDNNRQIIIYTPRCHNDSYMNINANHHSHTLIFFFSTFPIPRSTTLLLILCKPMH